jgi:hypothetical protein
MEIGINSTFIMYLSVQISRQVIKRTIRFIIHSKTPLKILLPKDPRYKTFPRSIVYCTTELWKLKHTVAQGYSVQVPIAIGSDATEDAIRPKAGYINIFIAYAFNSGR